MHFRSLALALALTLGVAACGSDEPADTSTTNAAAETTEGSETGAENTTRLWIGPDVVDCEGSAPQTCMLISESEDGEKEYFYDQIDGFTHVVGTSNVVDVLITEVDDPPADGSSLSYSLVSIVSETN